jgi:ubiquinone/menaquinone biosynthesis C-methylase UbiE
VWIFFNRQTDFLARPSAKVLHVAPEPSLEQLLRERFGDDYLTADFLDPRAMVQMDITNIQYPDNTFDVIYCSHVLEHVHDDRKAMREFARVLKPNSWAVLLVPIVADVTFEDPSITNPDEREKIFGQADHVRNYGLDYIDRLRESGFNVVRQRPSDFLDAEEIVKMGITPAAGDIYFCTHLTDANAR